MTDRADPTETADPISAIAALDEPNRRRLYDLVAARREPIGREEAAAAIGISRELTAFHLDRLVAAGLLETEFRRLGDRQGPGAGRPAKLYRRSGRDVAVTLPQRDYGRAADLFAQAVDRLPAAAGAAVRTEVATVARSRGRDEGREARRQAGSRPSRRGLRAALIDLLGRRGYAPQVVAEPARICLRSCPYDGLVDEHRDLTCGMNAAWAEGVVAGLGDARLGARLAPADGYCCVVCDLEGREPG
jgi:predicted ArsR family transcriptional regulator